MQYHWHWQTQPEAPITKVRRTKFKFKIRVTASGNFSELYGGGTASASGKPGARQRA